MGLKTYIGGPSNVPNSYLELAVPVAGDDVYVPADAGNCVIAADLPSSGQLRSFIVDDNYTGTINLNGYNINLFNSVVDAVTFNCGDNAVWNDNVGTGSLYFFTRNHPNANRVIMNNNTLSNINVQIYASGVYFVLNSDMYCNNFTILGNGQIYLTPTTSIMYNLYINGNAYLSTNYPGSTYWGQLFGFNVYQNVYLNGVNKNLYGSIYIRNVGSNFPTLRINGEYNLTSNFCIYSSNSASSFLPIYINKVITTNPSYNLYIQINKYGYVNSGITVDIEEVDNLVMSNILSGVFKIVKINKVNKFLSLTSTGTNLTSDANYQSNNTPNKALINLSDNCKYVIANSSFSNISFNKPVTAFKSSVNNCDNINVVDYPQTIISVK